jgi:uncharacterized protein
VKLEQSFDVRAPLEQVWEALTDPQRVAPCLPGAELEPGEEDGVYRGNFSVRLGPTTAAYRGRLEVEETDAGAHRTVMRASGQDKRGQGTANATIVSVLRAQGEVTHVDVNTDFTITGRLARFGRGGMIQDVSNRLMREFADCLQERIESEGGDEAPEEPPPATASSAAAPAAPAAKPVNALSLLLRSLWDRLRRLFGRG